MVISFIKNLSFSKRKISIPADYRPLYKIGHVVLVLKLSCRSGKASLMKLHFLCWTIKSKVNLVLVQQWIRNDFRSDYHVWGVEPTVNRALSYAIAEGYLSLSDGNYTLTQLGEMFYTNIHREKELFSEEKTFLKSIGKNTITEQRIKDLSSKFL